jgi:hypothetical protein
MKCEAGGAKQSPPVHTLEALIFPVLRRWNELQFCRFRFLCAPSNFGLRFSVAAWISGELNGRSQPSHSCAVYMMVHSE